MTWVRVQPESCLDLFVFYTSKEEEEILEVKVEDLWNFCSNSSSSFTANISLVL